MFPTHSFRALLGVAGLLLVPLTGSAQEDTAPSAPPSAPPAFVPNLPPDFRPPSFPPSSVLPPDREIPRTRTGPTPPRPSAGTPSAVVHTTGVLPDALPLDDALGIVDPGDPRMNDVVGSGAIVDFGTNEILQQLQLLTGKPILRQQNLPAVKITFDQGDKQLTRGQLIRAIQSLLALNGIALTKVGDDFIKAVPAAIINTQVPIMWEGSTLNAEPSQMIYEKIYRLDFLNSIEAIPLLQPLMSQGAPIAIEKSGIVMITDALVNLQRIERLLEIVDQPSDLPVEVLFFELKNVEAQAVTRRLAQIQAGPLRRRLENNTSFDADERTNQLIVFTHPSNKALIEGLIERMDIDVAPLTNTKVYSIRYAEAPEVVNIIEQVVTGQKEARDQQSAAQTANAARQAAQNAAQQRAANAAAAAVRSEASNLQFSDFLTLVADERANNIVASGTANDLRGLDSLVEQIDVLLAQVRIEAVIVEVTLSKDDASGISSLGFSYDQAADNADGTIGTITRSLTPSALGGITFGDGITWDSLGSLSLSAFVSAVDTNSRAEILSAPTIVTTHNREATIEVGERRPLITGTSTSTTSEFTSSQVQYQNIGITLSVTPLIGSNNVIQLEVEQTVEDVGELVQIDGNEQPTITSRRASSFVSVGDNQLVVLGGLQRVTTRDGSSKFPILGHIPLVDRIFTRKTESETRSEIILFLRPRIIRTADEANAVTREQISTMESQNRVEEYLESGTFSTGEEASPPPDNRGFRK